MRRLSEKLQELLLEFLAGRREFSGDCETMKKLYLILKALGRKVKMDENCTVIVECSHAS